MTDNIEKIRLHIKEVKKANYQALPSVREKLEAELEQMAMDRLHLLVDVLRHTRKNNPAYFTEAEHFAIHRERAAWFRVREAVEASRHHRGLINPRNSVLEVEDIRLSHPIPPALEKKVQHIQKWIELKKQEQ